MSEKSITSIQLGDSVNLVAGFKDTWQPTDASTIPYFLSSQQGLTRSAVAYTPVDPVNAFALTKHSTAEDVLSAIYSFTLVPTSKDEPVVGAGPLLVSEKNRDAILANYEKRLGVTLTDPNLRYVVAKFSRTNSTSNLNTPDVSDALSTVLSELPTGSPSVAFSNSLINFVSKWGSHFVNSIQLGDSVYQVFSYTADVFPVIEQVWAQVQFNPSLFQGYTAPRDENLKVGVAHEVGTLLTSANDPKFLDAVDKKYWYDAAFAKANSVFAIYSSATPNAYPSFEKTSIHAVPIVVKFTSIASLLVTSKLPLFLTTLTNLFLTKVGSAFVNSTIAPSLFPTEYSNTFTTPSPLTPVTSVIMTPQVSLFREILDLTANFGPVKAAETSQSVILVANVLQASDKANQVVIVAGLLFSAGTPNTLTNVPEIVVSDTAFDAGYFYFLDSIGFVQISTVSGKRLLVTPGNQAFTLTVDAETGRTGVVTSTPPVKLPDTLLNTKVPAASYNTGADRLSVFSFTAVSLDLNKDLGEPTLISNYLAFIGNLIPYTAANQNLLTSRTRALTLRGSIIPSDKAVKLVPYETYDQYKDTASKLVEVAKNINSNLQQAQTQIAIRKQSELIIDTATQLNENIKQSGQLLVNLVKATADNQGQLSDFYNSLASKNKQSLTAADADVNRLSGLVEESRRTLNDLMVQIKIEWNNWIIDQKVKLGFQIVASIFTLGFSVAEMVITEDPTKIFEILQKIADLMEVIKTLSDTIDSDGKPSEQLGDGQALMKGSLSDVPTYDEWLRLGVYLGSIFEDAPSDLPSLSKWAPAVKILMINGTSWTDSITQREAIRYQLYQNQELNKISGNFQANLLAQSQKYNVTDINKLDVDNVDLIGITDYLSFILSRTCQQLAGVLATQSVAVQYEYLARAVPLNNFDLSSLLRYDADLSQSIHDAIAALQPAPAPLEKVTIYVPVTPSNLAPGAVKNFELPVTEPEFFQYVMVRVDQAKFRVNGVKSTNTGKYEIQVTYAGEPFFDRNLKREILTFRTMPRIYSFVYDVATNKLVQGGPGPLDGKLTKITPFSKWSVSFPNSSFNVGLTFEDSPQIQVDIDSTVITKSTVPNALTINYALRTSCAPKYAKRVNPRVLSFAAAAPAAPTPVTRDLVLDQLSAGSVMMGWDCVLSMNRDKVNEILKIHTYDTPEFQNIPRTVQQDTTVTQPFQLNPNIKLTIKVSANFKVGAAKANFMNYNSNDELELEFPILEGSTYSQQVIAPPEYAVGPPIQGTVVPGTIFKAIVPIKQVGGTVDHLNVFFDLMTATDATYSFTDPKTGLPVTDPLLATAILQIFMDKGFQYLFITIDQSVLSGTIPELVPKTLRFSMYQGNKFPVLNMYIATTSKVPGQSSFGISQPLPDDQDIAMFISNRIVFSKIIKSGFENSKGWQMNLVEGKYETDTDSLDCKSGTLVVPFPPVSGIAVPGDKINLPMNKGNSDGQTGLVITPIKGKHDCVCNYSMNMQQPYTATQDSSSGTTTVTVSFTNIPITIDVEPLSKDEVQLISSYNFHGDNMTVDSTIKLDKDCCGKESNNQAQQQLRDNLRQYFPTEMANALNQVKFQSVSVLILESLLFPAKYIKLTAANTPADIVLWGGLDTK